MTALFNDKTHYCSTVMGMQIYFIKSKINSVIVIKEYNLGCALFYKPIWQLTVNERGHYADSEDTFLFKIEDSPDTRLVA